MLVWLTGVALAGYPSIDEPLKTGNKAAADTAVVIGVEEYFRLPTVPHARRDAGAVYNFLVYTRGIPTERVHLLERDGTRESMLAAVDSAVEQVEPGGTVWVYYAGHGAAASNDGARLWLGVDAMPSVASFDARGVRVDEVRKRITARDVNAMIFADACYTGTDRGGGALVPGARFAVPSYALKPRASVLEWGAASANEVSLPLEPAEHGVFTYLLLGALRGWADGELSGAPDGRVTADEASAYVLSTLRTLQRNDQHPQLIVENPASVVLIEGAKEKGPQWTASGVAASADGEEKGSEAPPMTVRSGKYKAGATIGKATIRHWGEGCGPEPRSYKIPDGGDIQLTLEGEEALVGTTRTGTCWSLNPALELLEHRAVPGAWETKCQTPPGEVKYEEGVYTLTADATGLDYGDESRFDWRAGGTLCQATIVVTQRLTPLSP